LDAIRHGGDLSEARSRAAAVRDWLDLSTGINPHAYPAHIAPADLTRLPQRAAGDALLAAARAAYRVPEVAGIVAAPGTQAILQWLPRLVPAESVAVVSPTYAEHAAVWARAGAAVTPVATLEAARSADVAVVVNPNNPDGRLHRPEDIAAFAAARRGRAVALIVDEAFGDLTPHLTAAGTPKTIVLRSFGKFYGLAGLRLGFAIAPPQVTERIAEALGPWAVSGPALAIGAQALADTTWAEAMRVRLLMEAAALDRALNRAGLPVVGVVFGLSVALLMVILVAPLMLGALIGGLLA